MPSDSGHNLSAQPVWDPFQDDSTVGDVRAQPWKAFWPPGRAENPAVWQNSEFPEVASWNFDATRPFDRPWRSWTSTACSKTDRMETSYHAEEADFTEDPYNSDRSRQTECAELLDTQIYQRQLRTVTATSFNYFAPLSIYLTEKPYLSRLPHLPEFARTNIVGRNRPVQIHDVRGHEDLFTLDTAGFEFTTVCEPLQDWTDAAICATYIPYLATWLKEYLNCTEVHMYAYSFRGRHHGKSHDKPWKTPFFRAHCDATAASCFKRLQLYLPEEKRALIRKRVRFINIWRPLTTPVQNSPLALCDYRTVSPKDLIPADIVFPHYLDEAYEVVHSPTHRWFYKQGMEDDDVILFKLADTAENVANLCPHSAFIDPSVPNDTPERASVEVRAIIID